jgi:hypothetical protein
MPIMINHKINRKSSSADFIGRVAKKPVMEERIDRRDKIVTEIRSLIDQAINPDRRIKLTSQVIQRMNQLRDMGLPLKRDEVKGAAPFIWEYNQQNENRNE